MSIPTKEVECETLNYKFHIDSQVISLSKKFKIYLILLKSLEHQKIVNIVLM